MASISISLASGRRFAFDDGGIGSGKEKKAFMSDDGREVICFFLKGLENRNKRIEQIRGLIDNFNPTVGEHGDFWSGHFCWPTDYFLGNTALPADFVAKHGLNTSVLAVVMPVYSDKFFFDLNGRKTEKQIIWFTGEKIRRNRMLPSEEEGDLLGLLHVCTWLARSIRKLHSYGVAHTDLSPRNVLISPRHGTAVTIDLDSVAIKGKYQPVIAGSPGYQAPEIIIENELPNIQTDLHSLAVLIYEILLKRHPIRGKRTFNVPAEEDELLIYGKRALFVENSSDKSNLPSNTDFGPYTKFGPHLTDCFNRAFVNGLHNPRERPQAYDWELALYRTLELLHPTLDGGSDWYVIPDQNSLVCPKTKRRPNGKVPIVSFYKMKRKNSFSKIRRQLVVWDKLRLEPWHIYDNVQPTEGVSREAYGSFHFENGKWWLHNGSELIMKTRTGIEIKKNNVMEISDGTEICMTTEKSGLLLKFALV